MIIRHLRQNVVAYLALAVALSTGTAYAADQIAAGSVTNSKLAKDAVTSSKIKKDGVKGSDIKDGQVSGVDVKDGSLEGSDIKDGTLGGADVADGSLAGADVADGSLTSTDLAPGLVPGDLTMDAEGGFTPTATPDGTLVNSRPINASAAGTAYVRWFVRSTAFPCAPGATPEAGLYLDGVPIPNSGSQVNASTMGSAELVAVVPLSAGAHTVGVRYNCPGVSMPSGGASFADQDWTVIFQPS